MNDDKPKKLTEPPKCFCGREAAVRRDGRHYCDEHSGEGYTRAVFAANAGD